MTDQQATFGYATVATAPSPASSGTVLVLAADFPTPPTPPYYASVWPAAVTSGTANTEIVNVTDDTAGTLTVARAQLGSVARSILVGDQVATTFIAVSTRRQTHRHIGAVTASKPVSSTVGAS